MRQKFTKLNKYSSSIYAENENIHIPVTASEIQELKKKNYKEAKKLPLKE